MSDSNEVSSAFLQANDVPVFQREPILDAEVEEWEQLEICEEVSFTESWNAAVDRSGFAREALEEIERYRPQTYFPLSDAPALEMALTSYSCNGNDHAILVIAPFGSALHVGGGVVAEEDLPCDYNLHSALAGEYEEFQITPNMLYYPQSFCFHPGAVPDVGPGNPVAPLPSSNVREVLTVDTARLSSQVGRGLYFDDRDTDGRTDQWPEDVVAGHGHAIADLIGRVIGEKNKSKLFGIRPLSGDTYTLKYQNGLRNRSFTKEMLLANLEAAAAAHCSASVLNLSLGAPNTPLAMRHDPVGRWLEKWIASGDNRAVVAAAGNHQTCVPNWPAAHSGTWGTSNQIKQKNGATLPHHRRFFSVGSEIFYDKTPGHDIRFSAEDDKDDKWIGHQRIGQEVHVSCPIPGDDVWTGTSFAAPQVAAELAMGIDPPPP